MSVVMRYLIVAIAAIGPVALAAPTSSGFNGPDLSADSSANIRKLILAEHNKYRKAHHAPNLVWNASLFAPIQNGINGCPDTDPSIAKGYSYGENWFGESTSGSPGVNFTQLSIEGVDLWGDEGVNYNYTSPGTSNGNETGHFTQIVWNSTVSVACAWNRMECAKPHWQVQFLCGYYPPGNVILGGKGSDPYYFYKRNVFPA